MNLIVKDCLLHFSAKLLWIIFILITFDSINQLVLYEMSTVAGISATTSPHKCIVSPWKWSCSVEIRPFCA